MSELFENMKDLKIDYLLIDNMCEDSKEEYPKIMLFYKDNNLTKLIAYTITNRDMTVYSNNKILNSYKKQAIGILNNT